MLQTWHGFGWRQILMYHNQQPRKSQLHNHLQSPKFLGKLRNLGEKYETREYISTTIGKNITKNSIGTNSNYDEKNSNLHCRKKSNQNNLVRTQFE